ncbi:MAG TPA: gamma-glutamyltranspeptidase [Acidimicrobiaceae bacterium]|nr:gamma-glutamyltranspeptidase [Acidimicrobiaceae bacterium]
MTAKTPSVPFKSRSSRNGMVCSIDHLASGAGVAVLRKGGSAADAAIAASAVLAVTSQHMCGVGGDLWALVHVPGEPKPFALNASGHSGSGAETGSLHRDGLLEMPFHKDPRSIPIPGCVDGWLALHNRFGRLPLQEVLSDAIHLAIEGFPISAECAQATKLLVDIDNTEDYFSGGPPQVGQIIRRAKLGETLQELAHEGRDSFYLGKFGEDLVSFGAGEYTDEDLQTTQADWVEPLSVEAFGQRIWSLPPNSQGYLCLSSAWIADQLDLPSDSSDPLFWHLLAEASLQAGFDRPEVLHQHANGEALIDPTRLKPRSNAISRERTSQLPTGINAGDTIYLNAVDADRMGVSLIQSNASGWGALVFLPQTRISLHNRGIGFSSDPKSAASYGPKRRPPHTLAPTLVEDLDGSLRALVGTMGGDSQPQIVLQLLTRLFVAGEDPGTALASPRWRFAGSSSTGFNTWADPKQVRLEIEGDHPELNTELTKLGHTLSSLPANNSAFGHAHIISLQDGVLSGAAEPRVSASGTAAY